jgi:hypothetical protein
MPANQRVGHLSIWPLRAAHTASDTAGGADRRRDLLRLFAAQCRASRRIAGAWRSFVCAALSTSRTGRAFQTG